MNSKSFLQSDSHGGDDVAQKSTLRSPCGMREYLPSLSMRELIDEENGALIF